MFGIRPLVCKEVKPGDRVLLNDGREVIVDQAAEYDNIFCFEIGPDNREWANLYDVAWNYTEAEFSSLDSEVNE